MKRWKKILLISGGTLVGLLVLLLVLGPAIAGSVAAARIPAIVGEQLQATATLGSVSVSWSGHVQIDDLRLIPKNFSDPLVEVKKIDVKVDVGSALGGNLIADVEVVAPKVQIEKGADGSFNYEFPPRPPKAGESTPKQKGKGREKDSGKPPLVRANLKIRDGEVKIRGKGRETLYQNLTVHARVDTLEKPVAYDLSLQSPLRDTLRVKGALDLGTISGPATLTLDRLSLRNLTGAARAYSDVLELDGTASGAFDYELRGAPRFVGHGKLEIHDFAVALQDRKLTLGRLTFSHDGGIDEKGNGKHVLTLSSGKAFSAALTAEVGDAFNARLVKTDLRVESDLAALTDVLRGTGTLPQGTAMAGTISLRGSCDSRGPAQADLDARKLRVAASVDLALAGSALDLSIGGQPMKLDGFRIRHRGTLDENGTGTNVITLESGKALSATVKVDVRDALGKTPLVSADLKADSDLGELGKLLEKLIGLKPDMAFEGAAALQGTLEAGGADAVKAGVTLLASNLVAVDLKDRKRHEIDKAIELKIAGAWDGKSRTAAADVLRLSSSFARVDGKGGASLAGPAPEIRETHLEIEADLEKLAGKLRSFMEKPPALGGRATLSALATGEKMAMTADFKGIRVDTVGPFDALLRHEGALDSRGSGRHTIRLDSGKAVALAVTADLKEIYQETRAVQVDLQLDSDLAAMSTMLPGLVVLKPGTTLAGAVAVKSHSETKGSSGATFDVAVTVDGLEAVENRKHREIDPAIRLKAAGAWDAKRRSLSLQTLALSSAFATADAKGGVSLSAPVRAQESSLRLQADLEKLGSKLGLFMADAPGLDGSLSASASYAGEKYHLDVQARGVKIVRQGKSIGPIDAVVAQKGTLSTAKDGALRIETGAVTSSAADITLSGEIRKVLEAGREGEIRLDAVARPLELSKWVPDLNLGGPEIKLSALVSLKPKLVTLSGQTKVDGLSMAGRDERGAAVTKTAKTGPVDFVVTLKGPDLLASLKTPAFEWVDRGYAARGGLDARVSYNDRGTTGTTTLSNLEISDGKKNVVKDPGLTIVHDIGLADQNRTIDLRKAQVSSTFLKGTITGKVLRLDPAMEFQSLHLAFKYVPDTLGAVVKPWLPGTLEGSEEKTLDVTLEGKAASTAPLGLLRGTRGGIAIDLAKFTAQGISLSGKTELRLGDGKLVSGSPLTVNKGTTDLEASIDFNPAEKRPQSSLAFKAKEVAANGQMGPLLEKINPIFHTSGVDARVDGLIDSDFRMTWTGPIDPGEKDWLVAASRSLSGAGTFGVRNLNIAGSPTLGQILSAIGVGNALQGELVASQVRIEGGRCTYENMAIRGSRKDAAALERDRAELEAGRQQLETERPQLQPREYRRRLEELRAREDELPFRYTLRFRGWVGFDKKMELEVLMPMTPGMIKAHPHLQKYLGTSFWVDLTGTTESPRLDLAKMLSEAAKRAAEGVLAEKATDLLSGLLKNRRREQQAEEAFNQAQQAEAQKDKAGALALYQRLWKDYRETDFVSKKKKAVIEERIRALEGK
jgi:hypothetical protein